MENKEMTLDQYQRFAINTADAMARDPLYLACAICEEAGEAAGKVKKAYRDNQGCLTDEMKREIALELGDVLWNLAAQAFVMGYDLSEIAEMNEEKIRGRISRGTIHGQGDHR